MQYFKIGTACFAKLRCALYSLIHGTCDEKFLATDADSSSLASSRTFVPVSTPLCYSFTTSWSTNHEIILNVGVNSKKLCLHISSIAVSNKCPQKISDVVIDWQPVICLQSPRQQFNQTLMTYNHLP